MASTYCRLLVVFGCFLCAGAAQAETIVLYGNDFEQPNVTPAATCATLDPLGINALYGKPDFVFNQIFTVEAVLVEAMSGAARVYMDPEMKAGKYTLGMLSTLQDDKLALTFDAKKLPFLNVGMDFSAIEVPGCGGPFGVAAPVMKLSLLDSPGGMFDWAQKVLSEQMVTGVPPADPFSFTWKRVIAALDASMSTDGHVSLVFDLTASGYAAFDNLSITASTTASVIDSDLDGKTDDVDNCRVVKNPDQANQDSDKAGDPCDPAPMDPTICGDQDGDGKDDCECPGECPPDGGATTDAGTTTDASAPMADATAGGGDTGGDAGAGARRPGGCGCSLPDGGLGSGLFGVLALGFWLSSALRRSRAQLRGLPAERIGREPTCAPPTTSTFPPAADSDPGRRRL